MNTPLPQSAVVDLVLDMDFAYYRLPVIVLDRDCHGES